MAADAEAIHGLITRNVPTGALLPRSVEFLAEHAHDFLVALDGTQVVGCVHLEEYAPSLAEVRSLAVEPGHQRAGYGSSLVHALEQLARVRGYATIFAVSNNESFFRRMGFEPRAIPELNRERSEISKFKGVFARDLVPAVAEPTDVSRGSTD
jgi:amino-acid N-acetyltransferase